MSVQMVSVQATPASFAVAQTKHAIKQESEKFIEKEGKAYFPQWTNRLPAIVGHVMAKNEATAAVSRWNQCEKELMVKDLTFQDQADASIQCKALGEMAEKVRSYAQSRVIGFATTTALTVTAAGLLTIEEARPAGAALLLASLGSVGYNSFQDYRFENYTRNDLLQEAKAIRAS